jgi:hypothetical protein
MHKGMIAALFLATTLLSTAHAGAGVIMCTDPATGKKTFTDKACPTPGSGKAVKVEPTNFGQGTRRANNNGTWKSDRDVSVSGRANMNDSPRHANKHYPRGYLPSGS